MEAGNSAVNFLNGVTPERRRLEAGQLDALFQEVTGWQPRLWQDSILGYGQYNYTYASGRSGRWLATGFAPRKAKLSVYILPGYTDFDPILSRLGKFRKGKSCLWINKLEDVDPDVLSELVRAGLTDLSDTWPVRGT